MAQVNGGFLHYMDTKKFLKNLPLRNRLSNFEIEIEILKLFHRNVPLLILFKNCSRIFDPSVNMALVNGGFLHYTDMKKFLKKIFFETAGPILK